MPANTKFQIRRTSVAGRTPNTTGSYATNSQYIAAGEFALNMTDQILYTSDGTNLLTVGANQVNQNVSGNLSLTTNNKRFNFTPLAGGANVYFIQQNDDNFVFYSTNTINQPRAIWSVFGNSASSSFNFNVPASVSNVYSTGSSYISNGFYVVAGNWGVVSANITLNSSNGNYQYLTSNAAYTITAPTQDCAIDILLTNGAGAGTITFSGFTVGSSTGSAYATTNANRYILSVRRINGISTYSWYALQ